MAEEQADTEEGAEKSSRKLPIMLAGIALAGAVIGAGGGYIAGLNSGVVAAVAALNDEPATDADGNPLPPDGEQVAAGSSDKEAVFLTLRPDFTANFNDGEAMRFMQLGLDVMARDEVILKEVEKFMPKVRYEILKILSRQNNAVYSPEGKDALLADILAKLREIITTDVGTVEDVYYTSFLIQ